MQINDEPVRWQMDYMLVRVTASVLEWFIVEAMLMKFRSTCSLTLSFIVINYCSVAKFDVGAYRLSVQSIACVIQFQTRLFIKHCRFRGVRYQQPKLKHPIKLALSSRERSSTYTLRRQQTAVNNDEIQSSQLQNGKQCTTACDDDVSQTAVSLYNIHPYTAHTLTHAFVTRIQEHSLVG